jgi:glycerol-1-phosphate dehydrogenase [NAD(P)+]
MGAETKRFFPRIKAIMEYLQTVQKITSIDDFLGRDSSSLARSLIEPCPLCGRKHPIPFGTMHQGRGAVEQIADLAVKVRGYPPKRAVMIYDKAIEGIIFPAIYEPLRHSGLAVEPFAMVAETGHLLDSAVINGNQAATEIGTSADLLIGAGSGVISDLTKWVATNLGLPFIICGTAPSMNGYTSITATITENDIKVSKFLNPSDAVVLDVDILANAPMAMIHAGIGDLAARAICNADWKLSQIQRKTSFCPLPYLMTAENERRYLGAATDLARREPAAIELLSEAVLLSGLSMTVMEGETSPSSGAEHVLSHFWDLLVHLRGIPKNFHGTQVGVGTIIMLNAYQYLSEIDPQKIDPQQVLRQRASLEAIEAENQALYGDKAVSFNEVARKKRIPDGNYTAYVRSILDGWESMWEGIRPYVAHVETIRRPFDEAGVPYHLSDIHRTRADAREALLHGSHYRPRYTILDLLWELGLFPAAADEILERSGVL